MGQQDVLNFLKKNTRKWFFAIEINKSLGTTFSSTTNSLRILRNANLIAFSRIGKRGLFRYRYSK